MAKILLVDDDPVILHIIHDMLHRNGYSTVSARSVKEAVRTLELDSTIDLVIADVVMPKADAFDLLRTITSIPRLAGIPVILCTSQGNQETLVAALRAGARDFIVKPFQAETLLTKVEKALKSGKRSVLIVEHKPQVRERLKFILGLEGFVANSAGTVEEVFEVASRNKVDVAIIDSAFPGMVSAALIVEIKKTCSDIPVLLITPASASSSGEIETRTGADGCLSMPLRNTEIIEKLREVTSHTPPAPAS